MRRHVPHAVDDRILHIGKDDIGILSHQFDIETFLRQVPQLVQLLRLNADDALQSHLPDLCDLSGSDVLPQQHAEARSDEGRRLVLFCEIDQRKRGVGRDQETIVPGIIFHCKEQLVILRHGDLGDMSARQAVLQFFYEIRNDDTVKSHKKYPFCMYGFRR